MIPVRYWYSRPWLCFNHIIHAIVRRITRWSWRWGFGARALISSSCSSIFYSVPIYKVWVDSLWRKVKSAKRGLFRKRSKLELRLTTLLLQRPYAGGGAASFSWEPPSHSAMLSSSAGRTTGIGRSGSAYPPGPNWLGMRLLLITMGPRAIAKTNRTNAWQKTIARIKSMNIKRIFSSRPRLACEAVNAMSRIIVSNYDSLPHMDAREMRTHKLQEQQGKIARLLSGYIAFCGESAGRW